METNTIFDYVSRWKYLIIGLSIAASVIFSFYLKSIQEYTASVTIEYKNPDAKYGYTPDGTIIDPSEIYSANIISKVIEDMGLDMTIDQIRTKCEVKEIIPEDEKEKKEAAYKNNEEYFYFPTRYEVTYTVDSEYDKTFAINMLNSIIDNYFAYYSEEYINKTNIPANPASLVDSSYDYIENADIINNTTNNMLGYLKTMVTEYPDYRSSTTGYAMDDLYELYKTISQTDIPALYAVIIDNCATKNNTSLMQEYTQSIDRNRIRISDYNENLDEISSLIEMYSAKNSADQNYQMELEDNEIDKNRKNVINYVYENESNPSSTYDNIIKRFIESKDACNSMETENEFKDYLLSIFTDAGNMEEDTIINHIAESTDSIVEELDGLYGIVLDSVKELNQYLGTSNIYSINTAYVCEKLNIRLYVMLVMLVFIIIGTLGTIIICKLVDNIKHLIFVDEKTSLPNSKYCDLIISNYSNKVLDDDFSFILLSLDNLKETNQTQGYHAGDKMLKTFSDILADTVNTFGTVVYNKTNQFFVFLPDSNLAQSEHLIHELKKAVKSYDTPYSIEFSYSISESKTDNIYSIRKLIAESLAKMEKQKEGEEISIDEINHQEHKN